MFGAVYYEIVALRFVRGRRRLRADSVDELVGAMVASFCAFVDMRWRFRGETYASDATTTRGAVVCDDASPEVEDFIVIRVPCRGGSSCLFSRDGA